LETKLVEKIYVYSFTKKVSTFADIEGIAKLISVVKTMPINIANA